MGTVRKYLGIIRVLIKNNWIRETLYRQSFLTHIVTDFVWIIVEAGLFTVIYSHVDSLAGWTREQVYFFLGVFFASDALFTMLFMSNFWYFGDLVNRGELDVFLTKPANTLFLVLTRFMNFTSLANFSLGVWIAFRYAEAAGVSGGLSVFKLGAWLAFGLLSQLLLRFAFTVWMFWTERGRVFVHLYYQMFAMATKPHTIYPQAIRYLILTALPFAFIGSIPARALIHGLTTGEWFLIVGVLSFFSILNLSLWKRGLLRYQSASS